MKLFFFVLLIEMQWKYQNPVRVKNHLNKSARFVFGGDLFPISLI